MFTPGRQKADGRPRGRIPRRSGPAVAAEVGVVEERRTVGGEDPADLVKVGGDDVGLAVDERVETEHEVDGSIFRRGERPAVSGGEPRATALEPFPARRDAAFRQVHAK